MKDVYVLQMRPEFGGTIILIADDPERCNLELARFTAVEQARMLPVQNYDMRESGD